MGRETRTSHNESHGRAVNHKNGERKTVADKSENRLYMQAYQAILARELLINDFNEQDRKYF